MVIVSEIADLAVEADRVKDETPPDEKSDGEKDALINVSKPASKKKGLPVWPDVDFEKANESDDKEESKKVSKEPADFMNGHPRLTRSPSGSIKFKSRLEKWNEPTTHDKVNQIDHGTH